MELFSYTAKPKCLYSDAMQANVRFFLQNSIRSAEIRRKFQEYDRDGNGSVTLREAHDVLRKVN